MRRPTWTEEKIKEGIDRFTSERGHSPTARDIDLTDYLPSSRIIQKRFGGLQKMHTYPDPLLK